MTLLTLSATLCLSFDVAWITSLTFFLLILALAVLFLRDLFVLFLDDPSQTADYGMQQRSWEASQWVKVLPGG